MTALALLTNACGSAAVNSNIGSGGNGGNGAPASGGGGPGSGGSGSGSGSGGRTGSGGNTTSIATGGGSGTGGGAPVSCGRPVPTNAVDLTPQILANAGNNDIVLSGQDYVVTFPAGAPLLGTADPDNLPNVPNVPTIYYNGVLSGIGTVTVKVTAPGAVGRLVLTNRSTYAVPLTQQAQFALKQGNGPTAFDGVSFPNGTSAIYVSHHVNPPALYIQPGVTVQLGSQSHPAPGGVPAEIFSQASNHTSDPAASANFDNIQNNGLLVVNSFAGTGASSTWIHLGAISGCGDLTVTASGGSMALSGVSTYTGKSIFYATNIGDTGNFAAVANTSAVFNAFVLVYNTPIRSYFSTDQGPAVQNVTPAIVADPTYFGTPGVLTIPQHIYGSHHGNSIHNIGRGGIDVFTGHYTYSDSGDQRNPSLQDQTLDYTSFAGNASHRILYLHGGSITQFGDGTTSDLFVKGNEVTVTLGLQSTASLGLFYRGIVPFNIPINSAANANGLEGGDLFIMGAPGAPANHVVLTQPAYYRGATHIDANAVLQLGDGTPGNSQALKVKPVASTANTVDGTYSTSGGNGSILTPGTGDGTGTNTIVGAGTNLVLNDGQLVIDNVVGARDGITQTTLSHIGGVGSLTQMGSAPLTLLGSNTYSGGTTVEGGTLLVAADTSLGTGPVMNDGTIGTSGSQRNILVGGDFVQNGTATLRLEANGAGASGVAGTVKVGGRAMVGGALVINGAAGFAPTTGQKLVVVQAAGGVTGTFSSVTLTGTGPKLTPGYDATSAFVTVGP